MESNQNEVLENYKQIYSSEIYSGYECDISIVEYIKFLKIDEIDSEIYNKVYEQFKNKLNKPLTLKYNIACYDPDLYCLNYKDMHEIQVLYDIYMNNSDMSNLIIIIFVEQITEQYNLIEDYINNNQFVSPKINDTNNYLIKYLKSKNAISRNEKALKPNITKSKLEEEISKYKYYELIPQESLEKILNVLNVDFSKKYEQSYKQQLKAKAEGIRKPKKKIQESEEEETTIIKDDDINRARDNKFYLGLDTSFEWMSLMNEKARQIIFY